MANPIRFIAGGTVQAGNGIYIPRRADEELLRLCQAGELAHILASRQIGKSSLMVRTAERLLEQGYVVVLVDLQAIGEPEQAEAWYRGLVHEIGEQTEAGIDASHWWKEHDELGPAQRFAQFLRAVLNALPERRIVLFFDEIDTTLHLSYTDDFFGEIQALYNNRAGEPFRRLSFVLLGTTTPAELIKGQRVAPFNVGSPIHLSDFTAEEAKALAAGLGVADHEPGEVTDRVLHWTGGHPYLTLKVFKELHDHPPERWSEAAIDGTVSELFLRQRKRGESNLEFVRGMLTRPQDRSRRLDLYVEIHKGRRVYDDRNDVVKSQLKLSGIVRSREGRLEVRNQIYREVFTPRWAGEARGEPDWRKWFALSVSVGVPVSLVLAGIGIGMRCSLEEIAEERDNAWAAEEKARDQEELANARLTEYKELYRENEGYRLAALAREHRSIDYTRGSLLAVEAARFGLEKDGDLDAFVFDTLQSFAQQPTVVEIPETITQIRFSPDGTHIATTLDDRSIAIWPTEVPVDPILLRGHEAPILDMAFDPTSRRLATASSDRTARIWSIDGVEGPLVLRGHGDEVSTVRFSEDGAHVISGSNDGTAMLWDASTGRRVHAFDHSGAPVTVAKLSPDGMQLVTGTSGPEGIHVWSVEDPGVVLARRPITHAPLDVLFGEHHGTVFASTSRSIVPLKGDALWDDDDAMLSSASLMGGPRCEALHFVSSTPNEASFSTAGREPNPLIPPSRARALKHAWIDAEAYEVVAVFEDGTIAAWRLEPSSDGKRDDAIRPLLPEGAPSPDSDPCDLTTKGEHGRPIVLEHHYLGRAAEPIRIIDEAFDPRRRQIAIAEDHRLWIWSVDPLGEARPLRHHREVIDFAKISPHGSYFATRSLDGSAALWTLDAHPQPRPLDSEGIEDLWFSPDDGLIAALTSSQQAKVWITDPLEPITPPDVKGLLGLDIGPDRRIATTSVDGLVHLWSRSTDGSWSSEEVSGVRAREGASLLPARFGPSGDVLLAARDDIVLVWQINRSAPPQELHAHVRSVRGVDLDDAGTRILSWSEDAAVVWSYDGDDAAWMRTWSSSGPLSDAVLGPGGNIVVTINEHEVSVWLVDGGREPIPLHHEYPVVDASFSPDGASLVTIAQDGIPRIWSIPAGTLRRALLQESSALDFALFTPDGEHMLAMGDEDGTARLWPLDPRTTLGRICTTMAQIDRTLMPEERRDYLRPELRDDNYCRELVAAKEEAR